MKRILMRGGKTPFKAINATRIVKENVLSNNNGNMLFLNSMHKALSAPGVEIVVNRNKIPHPDLASQINAEYDMLVIPLANALKIGGEGVLDQWANLIKKLTIPCVVTGVGAQAKLDINLLDNSNLSKSVKNFVGAVLDRSSTIGVRGDFTYQYLNKLGFNAVEVIGCPSMFTMGNVMNVQKKTEELGDTSNLTFNFTRKMPENICDFMGRVLLEVNNIRYVPQDIDDLRLMMWGRSFPHFAPYDVIPNHIDHPVFRENRALYFMDSPNWFSYMKSMDFSFGTRIHGNISALLSGTPGLVIAHDSRTLELAEYFDIPYIKGADINDSTSINDLYLKADYTNLNKGHETRFNRFRIFLENNSINHIYKYEGAAEAYQERLNNVDFYQPLSPLTSENENVLLQRTLSLLAEVNGSVSRINSLEAKINSMEKEIKMMNLKEEKVKSFWERIKGKLRGVS